MNAIQIESLELFILKQTSKHSMTTPNALYEALGCTVSRAFETAIFELLDDNAYVQPNDLTLSTYAIQDILDYGAEVDLDITLGFGSVLESYVVSNVGIILEMDLIELI